MIMLEYYLVTRLLSERERERERENYELIEPIHSMYFTKRRKKLILL